MSVLNSTFLRVSDVASPAPVITLPQSASLADLLRTLDANKIGSCAIVDKAGHPLGWCGYADVVRFFVGFVYEAEDLALDSPHSHVVRPSDLERLTQLADSHRIKAVLQASRPVSEEGRSWEQGGKAVAATIAPGNSLRKALKALSRGAHQLPIVTNGKVTGVLSQRDVLSFFAANPARLGGLRAATVQGMGLGHAVFSVRQTDVALDAFWFLAQKNYQGAAVLDSDGRLTHVLSITDFGRAKSDFLKLKDPVLSFVSWQKGVVLAQSETTVEQLVASMVEHRVRRVFVVNNAKDRQPQCIITASDLCALLRRELGDGRKDGKKKAKQAAAPKKGGKDGFKHRLEHQASKKGGKRAAWKETEKK